MNILTIFCAGKIAGKLAWKILNELRVCWVGIGLVLCPFTCDVFVMYWSRTPPLAPSEIEGGPAGGRCPQVCNQLPGLIVDDSSPARSNRRSSEGVENE